MDEAGNSQKVSCCLVYSHKYMEVNIHGAVCGNFYTEEKMGSSNVSVCINLYLCTVEPHLISHFFLSEGMLYFPFCPLSRFANGL